MAHVMIKSKKCTGCHMCELACSAYHEGAFRPSVTRLFADVNPTDATVKGRTCLQTGCAKCQEACPSGAIITQSIFISPKGDFAGRAKIGESFTGHVLVVDESKCTNCGDCYGACPTGTIHEHPTRGVALKCDLCGGEPQCIAFCQNPHVLAVDLKLDRADRLLAVGA